MFTCFVVIVKIGLESRFSVTRFRPNVGQIVLKSDLKKSRIYHIWGQSDISKSIAVSNKSIVME